MRITIDARFFGPFGKGLGRYTQRLIEHLEQVDDDNDYTILLRKENFDTYTPRNIRFQKQYADCQWYTTKEQVVMPKILKETRPDLVHFPHFNVPIAYRRPFVVTIHDLILLHYPTVKASTLGKVHYWSKYLAYRVVIANAISRAQYVLAMSHATKKDVTKKFSIQEEKIGVTYQSWETLLNPKNKKERDDKKICEQYGIIKPYILYVGNAYPHKNLERLINAFKRTALSKKGVSLVLVGKDDYFYNKLKKKVREENVESVRFAGMVSDEDLPTIYKKALFYVMPSLHEGFGLTPLEAMSMGTPVTAADHACTKEILGRSAHYFNGHDTNQIVYALKMMTANKHLRGSLVEKGYANIKRYNWKKMALETKKIYQTI
ncbi:MAG: glycosyltransferase family 4 protein [Candidatus Moranbacteria bacterium]|nr:glycosyltransferase family 4 protein [Candidatus Moranbacteria bacterium]